MPLAQKLDRDLSKGMHGMLLLTGMSLAAGAPLPGAAHAASPGASGAPFKYWQAPGGDERELSPKEPMPPGFQVIVAEFEWPVIAESQGKTLYTWPLRALRNGATGDREGGPSA